MSPEQGTGGKVDARSDVYSAGVVLYELITGDWPFTGESRTEMLKAHLLTPPPTLAEGCEGLMARPEMDALVQKALAKDVDDRFPSAVEMLAALEGVPKPAAWMTQRPGERPGVRGGALPALGAVDHIPAQPQAMHAPAPMHAPQPAVGVAHHAPVGAAPLAQHAPAQASGGASKAPILLVLLAVVGLGVLVIGVAALAFLVLR